MDSSEFVQAYRRKPIEAKAPETYGADTFMDARKYADVFALLLHDVLSGNSDDETGVAAQAALANYPQFIGHGLRELDTQLYIKGDDESLAKLNEINFHWLNYAMLPMWELLMRGDTVSPEERKSAIRFSQDMLAYDGCFQYFYRDKLAGAGGDYHYFGPEMYGIRHTHEGRLHERDAAIALLDIARTDESLIVVPSPGVFEHSHNKAVNVDFMVIDTRENRAVGVQVKSRITPENLLQYDNERIVFIDGSVDLGNSRYMRTSFKTSKKREVSWAGILSADHMKGLQTQGRHTTLLTQMYPLRNIVQTQINAKIRLGNLKVNRRGISTVIEERIRAKL